MKTNLPLAVLLILIAGSSSLSAGSVSGSLSSESLIVPQPIESVSVGLNYDEGKRQIKYNAGNIELLESHSYSLYIGYDMSEWCTFFATLGTSAARLSEQQKFGDAKSKWSLGVNANLWHIEIENPPLFSGRISLKPAIEFAQFNSSIDNNTVNGQTFQGALFFAYDKVIDDPKYSITEFYGYSIYAGPALSLINGSSSGESDFKEDRSFGIIGGLDFFFTRNLSIGCQVQSFGKISFSGNVRCHF